MKFLGFDYVYCLSPHPDDVEISMSGTIAKYHKTFFQIITLSQGTTTDKSTGLDRHNEVKEFWRKLGLHNVGLSFSKFRSLEDCSESELITYLEEEWMKIKGRAIIGPPAEDSHFEHRYVNGLMYALTRHEDGSIIEYKTPSTLSTWLPNMSVDITKFNNKSNLETFESQMDSPYLHQDNLKVFYQDFTNYRKGHHVIEQFKIKTLYR